MKYRISKPADDQRAFVACITLPDGFYRILDMSRYNGRNLLLAEAIGYVVEELPETDKRPSGLYEAETDKRVVDASALAKADHKGDIVYASEDYQDPAAYLGMTKAEKARRKGKKAPMTDPASAARAARMNREALEQLASEQRAAASLGVRRGNR